MKNEETWVEEKNRLDTEYGNEGKFKRELTARSIYSNKIVRGWIFLTIFAATLPVLMYYFIIDQGTYKANDSYTCLVQREFRVPCGRNNITANDCRKLACCFEKSTSKCYHFLPSKYSYAKATNEYIAVQSKTPYGTDSIRKLYFAVNEKDENKVSIIVSQENVENQSIGTEKNYTIKLAEDKLMVEIYRNTGECLLSTAKGPLIASKNYWEWSFYLTNHSLFGLNRTLINTRKNFTFTNVVYQNKLDHSISPVLWAYYNKKFHGVLIKHAGPLEIVILPSNMVILKSLTGGLIELELSTGPTPRLLHDQQIQKDDIPPYWSLQSHRCRKGDNLNLTELLQDYSTDNQINGDCIHENLILGIMKDDNKNENADEVKRIIKSIKEKGSQFLLSVSPHIPQNFNILYNKSVELDILYKYNNSIYTGKYLGVDVVYPNYNHALIKNYLEDFRSLLTNYMDPEDIDGMILHDNWPLNENYFVNGTDFPYFSQELQEAMSYTLPWNSTSENGSTYHIFNHNSYGSAQIDSFQNYFNINFIMSASRSFEKDNPSIIQNVNVSWGNLRAEINNVLFKSISGNHLVSVPVCGDTTFFNTQQEILCLRWYLIAATLPMFTISSYEPWREPTHLNSVFGQNVALRAINLRNKLLPYYYTILNKNEPVIRPMFYDYFENERTFSLDSQFMIGESVLVAHPFSEGRRRLQIFMPSCNAIWYELWGGQLYNSTSDQLVTVDVVETDLVAFISQGNILPLKEENKFDLIIALNCTNEPCQAEGSLFDQNIITFISNETALTVSNINEGSCNYTLGNISLYYYNDTGGFRTHFTKNDSLCTTADNLTIFYELRT